METKIKTLFAVILLFAIATFAQTPPGGYGPGAGGGGNATNGVGGSTNAASPQLAYYLTNVCPTSNTGQCYFTPADTVIEENCTWTAASTLITCPNANFTLTAKTTQIAWGFFTAATGCNPDQTTPYGGSITTTHSNVSGVASGTTLNLNANPANANAGGGCFMHGTPDDTGAAALDAALAASTQCPKIELAAAGYTFTTFHLLTNPTSCVNLMTQWPLQAAQGNIVLANGETLEGRGVGSTVWYLPPDFPETGSCVNGILADACFAMPLLAHWHDFSITGSGNLSLPSSKVLLAMNLGQLDYFSCYNVGVNSASSTGLEVNYWARGTSVNLAGCGQSNMHIRNTAAGTFFRLWLEVGNLAGGGSGVNLTLDGQMTCIDCGFLGTFSGISTPVDIIQSAGSYFVCQSCGITTNSASATSPIGIRYTGNGNTFTHLVDTGFTNGVANPQFFSIQNNMSGGTLSARFDNVNFVHGSSGFSINDNNTGGAPTYIFDSQTRIDPTGWAFGGTNQPTIVAAGHSLLGACTGVATASSTLGLYGTGPLLTTTTCTSTTIGGGEVMQRATTLSSLRCTSSATTVSVTCKVLVNGVASTITCTMTASTICTDFAHTVALNPGDLVSEEIVTGAAETGANIKAFVLWQP